MGRNATQNTGAINLQTTQECVARHVCSCKHSCLFCSLRSCSPREPHHTKVAVQLCGAPSSQQQRQNTNWSRRTVSHSHRTEQSIVLNTTLFLTKSDDHCLKSVTARNCTSAPNCAGGRHRDEYSQAMPGCQGAAPRCTCLPACLSASVCVSARLQRGANMDRI